MKKYIYSQHHLGLVLAPKNSWWLKDTPEIKAYMEECKFLYDNPEKHTMPTHRLQAKEWEAYNTWLSSPPVYKVREEDIKDFLEPIDESRFEVRVMAEKCSSDSYWYKNRLGELFEFEEWNNGYKVAHGMPDVGTGYAYIQYEDGVLVAIPKKGNESKEQSPSVEQVLNDTTIYGRPLSDFLLPDQIERLAEYLQKALFL
jgi:hypothetical protein